MMRFFVAFAASVAVLSSSAIAAPPTKTDREALERLAFEADAAWNAKDAAQMSHKYTEDSSIRLGDSVSVSGRSEIRNWFQQSFANRNGEMRHITRLQNVEMISADVALSDAQVTVEQRQADGSWKPIRQFRNNNLSQRTASGWLIRTLRAYPLPPAP